MALFTLTDIKFNKGNAPRLGAASGSLAGGKYDTNLFKYPQDLGNYDKGHYLVIHINEQEHTQFKGEQTGDLPTIIANRTQFGSPSPYKNLDTVLKSDAGNYVSGLIDSTSDFASRGANFIKEKFPSTSDAVDGASGLISGLGATGSLILKGASSIQGVRTIRRTSETIALYMPDTVNFVHNQNYSDASLTGLPAAVLAGGASLAQSLKNSSGSSTQEITKKIALNMSPYIANYAMKELMGDFGRAAFAAGFGMVQNPILELLYTSPQFRSFRFDFMLYPRSASEAFEVQQIINRLHFHQAPEVRKEMNGYFLVPPSEFDIKFFYNGAENPNIPKISTCVLESIDIDYAPNGYSTYEVPGQVQASTGGTGMPVAIRLSLQFKETEIMTKDNFASRHRSDLSKLGVSESDYLTGSNGMGNYGE
jgi:hypothetical protein